jgi:nuclear transport factor 2 (NTF2) superfamily protein
MSRPPLPPFTAETAIQKARLAEDHLRPLTDRDRKARRLSVSIRT